MSEGIRLYNTLTRSKEPFAPIDPNNVRMYVCGPTVYDYAHIGNARPAIVFDVLFRLLRHVYGPDHVTYVRNITDVDDKINARALRDFGADIAAGRLTLNAAIRKVTETTYDQYQKDVAALGCLPPTVQPRATEFVLPRADGKSDMVTLIQSLIDRGHAYVARGEAGAEVLFDTASMPDYGRLSKRNLDEQQAGARVAVEAHKKNPADFVLWKESSADEPGWQADFDLKDGGHDHIHGRPGWHIECSAMAAAYLGQTFDIHGGGLDLIFPHHENEIAQSRCAHGTHAMANVWMHNGFVQVEGRKMSKSDGNFVTIHDLLHTDKFGGRPWHGGVLRYAMLMTHYQQPIDWTWGKLLESREEIYNLISSCDVEMCLIRLQERRSQGEKLKLDEDFLDALKNDMNTPLARARLHTLSNGARADTEKADKLLLALEFLGVVELDRASLFDMHLLFDPSIQGQLIGHDAFDRLERLRVALANHDAIRERSLVKEIESWGVRVAVNRRRGEVSFEFREASKSSASSEIETLITHRLALIAQKNWAEADRIRDELLARGIQLKDGKDPVTGERITTWEVKR